MNHLHRRRRLHVRLLASPSGRGSELSSGEGFPSRQRRFPHPLDSSRPLPEGEAVDGFTLLEIILALAILAGSLAALGEVMRLADQNASMTRDESQAQILAASVMDELVAGARELVAIDRSQFDFVTEPPWVYSVLIESTAYQELVAVRVLVEQDIDPRLQPARFALVRWLPNPDYIPPAASTSSTSSSSTGSSGTGASGAANWRRGTTMIERRAKSRERRAKDTGFTLFELVLAIALSVALSGADWHGHRFVPDPNRCQPQSSGRGAARPQHPGDDR